MPSSRTSNNSDKTWNTYGKNSVTSSRKMFSKTGSESDSNTVKRLLLAFGITLNKNDTDNI